MPEIERYLDTMVFWITILAVTVMVLVFVFLPVWRLRGEAGETGQGDLEFHQSRLKEIDNDLDLGRIDKASAEAARTEEARRLIKASRLEPSGEPVNRASPRWLIAAAVLFVPAFSLPVYLSIGNPPIEKPLNEAANSGELAGQSLQNLVAAVEKRLEENPDDAQGWSVIAPVYVHLNQFEKAVEAYRNAVRLSEQNPALVVGLAESVVMLNEGRINTEARTLFDEALRLQPGNATALFYTGMAAYREENWRLARDNWQIMIDGASGNEEWYPVVYQRVQELQERLREGPEQDDRGMDFPQGMTPEERQQFIEDMVASLAERLEEEPDDQEGWLRLVRSYMVLGKKQEADQAIEKAKLLFAEDREFMDKLRSVAANGSNRERVE